MTMQSFAGRLYPSCATLGAGSNATTSNMIIDASGEKAALMFTAEKAGDIAQIIWRTRTTTTGATVDVRVETISAQFPSGTLFGTNTNGSHVVGNGDDNVYLTTTLTSPATVALGDKLAVVIVQSTGNMQVGTTASANLPSSSNHLPKGALYTASWSAQANLPVIYLVYSDGEVIPASGMFQNVVAADSTFDSADSPDEVGNLFRVPASCAASGAIIALTVNASATGEINLLDSANTVLATALYTADESNTLFGTHSALFDSQVNLQPGTDYRIAVKPTHASATTIVNYTDRITSAKYSIFGTTIQKTSRTNAGSWTEDSSRIICLWPIFSGFDDGAAVGGGLLTHPGMSGGMRG